MNQNQSYYFALDHDNDSSNVTLNVTIYVSTCRFWNESVGQWEGTGCRPSHKTSRQLVVCTCNHLTSFGSSIDIAPNKLDFTVLKVITHNSFYDLLFLKLGRISKSYMLEILSCTVAIHLKSY